MLRPVAPADVPAVAALYARTFPCQDWLSLEDCAAYFGAMLFDSPLRDPELPSWVVEEGGRVCGLYAVQVRRMRLRGRPLRAAVGGLFMVDPERRGSLVALQLLKACLNGPQDLTFADGANDAAMRLWRGLGGSVAALCSLHWVRLLRPCSYALTRLRERGAVSRTQQVLLRPAALLCDAAAARLRRERCGAPDDPAQDEPLAPAVMHAHLAEMAAEAELRPLYGCDELAWLLGQAAAMKRHGALRARLVRDRERQPAGWYLHYVRAGAPSEVLQLAARRDAQDLVVRRMLADAWRQGATAVRGRLEPVYARALSDRHCWFRWDAAWTLVHSRDPAILAALHAGDVFLSRLEGEWWLRFHGG